MTLMLFTRYSFFMGYTEGQSEAPKVQTEGASLVFTIYCHKHVDSGRRYIGLTKKTMMQRWNRHVYSATHSRDKNSHCYFPNAIRKYGKDAFLHEVLEVCDTLESANAAEIKWIEFYDTRNREKGFNLTKGGSQPPKDPDTYKARVSAAVLESLKDPVVRKRRAKASKKMWQDPEFRSKVSSAIKQVWSDPDYKIIMSTILTEVNSRPEVKAKIGNSAKGRIFSEETRKKISVNRTGKKHSPETLVRIHTAAAAFRDKMSQIVKARWADPEFRARHGYQIS